MSLSSPESDEWTDGLPPERPLSVLLIDDNPSDVRFFEKCLREGDGEVTVRHEANLEAGLQRLRGTRPDVLVAGLKLPDSEGAETVRALLADAPEVPVVVLAGQGDQEAALAARTAGATEHLQREEMSPTLVERTLRWTVRQSRMQAKLRRRDAWIRSITEGLSAGIFRAGPTGRIEYANEALVKMLGAEGEEELIGRDLTTFYTDSAQRGRMLAEEEVEGVEVEFERLDGSAFVGLLTAEPARGKEGQVHHFDGFLVDITERVETEKKLRQSRKALADTKARYESLVEEVFNKAPVGAFVLDDNFKVAWANEAIEDFFNLDRDEIIGEDKRQLLQTRIRQTLEEPEAFAETVGATYRENTYDERFECHVLPAEGREERWLEHQSQPVEHGRYEGGRMVIYSDITDRKAEERRRRQVISRVTDAIVEVGPDWQFTLVNEQAETLYGMAEEDLLGKSFWTVFPGALGTRFEEEYRAVMQSREPTRFEEHYPGLDGWFDIQVYPNEDGGVAFYFEEITERKEREERLRQNQARLEVLFEHSPDMINLHDREGRLLEPNARLLEKTGYAEEELASMRVWEIDVTIGPEEARRVWERMEPGDSRRLEGVYQRKDGSTFPVEVHIRRLDLEGEDRFVVISRDITERKRWEQEVKSERELVELVLDHTDSLIFGREEALRSVWRRGSFDQFFGVGAEKAPTLDAFLERVVHPDDRQTLRQFYRSLTEGERDAGEMVYRTNPKLGPPQRIRENVYVEESESRRIVGLAQNVTDRKRREQALEERREKMEALYEATRGLLTAESLEDVSNRIHEALQEVFDYALNNTAFTKEGRIVPQKTTGDRARQVPYPESQSIEGNSVSAQALLAGETVVVDDVQDLENEVAYGEMRSAAAVPIGERGVIVVSQIEETEFEPFDLRLIEVLASYATLVLARLEREDQLVEAKEEAEEASRLKTAVLANMSHEIRTPLTSITGFAELLKENLEGEMGMFADRVYESGKRLMKALDSVLQLSKLEAGAYEMERKRLSLGTQIQETTEMLDLSADEEGIDLRLDLPEEPIEGLWNEGAVNRILENLLENAIKFTPEGGTVEVRAWTEQDHAALAVEDTGIGISDEALPHVFEPFKQESEGLAREYEGTGLGLSIVRRLTDALGGSVEVESEKGEGTCFTVRLPKRKGAVEGGAS